MLEVKQAIRTALDHTAEYYSMEKIRHLGLEEVEYNEEEQCWEITVGFQREWDEEGAPRPSPIPGIQLPPGDPWDRTYKSVRIDAESGKVLSFKARILSA